ncbi:MAG: mechanosensitive ion channel family protein [Rhodobacteraceae bacterium]|nr:mechanosensitive ion channel family protein [Paracoccaceae bacterium]MCY4141077.1 mechanosensitive ion channel family protein [Paracoccaceae bacterium]
MKILFPNPTWKFQAVRVARQAALKLTGLMMFLVPTMGRAQVTANDADEITRGNSTPWVDIAGLSVLELGPWQWITLAALAALAWFISVLVIKTAFRILLTIARRSRTSWDTALFDRVRVPARLATSVALFYGGAFALQLPVHAYAVVSVVCKVLIVVSIAWLLARLVDLFSSYVEGRLAASGNTATITLLPLGRRTAKVFIGILAVLSVLQNLGFSIGGLLAGLGIGGLAVALAAQKTLENLFGGFVLVADRPVRIGDFCRAGEHLGTIEDIGIRSSRIRTLDRTLVCVPNAELSTVRIENYGVRDKMRLYTVLQFGYDTSPDQIRYLLVELRSMLYAHPKTLPDPCRVRFINFGAHSLDIEIFVFIETADWNEFTGIREDIYLRILDIAAESGAYFAYPSQTLYLGRDGGRDVERTASAEAAVGQWRAEGTLPIPEFPESRISEIVGTLDYPAPGSSIGDRATAT